MFAQKTITLYDGHLRGLINNKIVEHIQHKNKVTELNLSKELPYSVYSKRTFEIFNALTDGVNISAKWKNDNPQTGVLEIYDYDRKRQKPNTEKSRI